jgi:uncharacterized membrane protein YdjX (TVP38/TMEM64 family)
MAGMSPAPDQSTSPAKLHFRFWLRLVLTLTLVTIVVLFYGFGWHRYFRWDELKARLTEFDQAVHEDRLRSALIFAAVYIGVTALSLPVSTWLSLLAGALFGRWLGTGIVSVSATIGATLAFLSSRFLIRDWIESRFRNRLSGIQKGIEEDGAFYVLLLRLVPLFPFFLVNLGLGVTRVRLRTYVALSWVGMLPANFLFVNAGTAIREIEKPQDILSWKIILSLSALGLFPLLGRWVYRAWRRRREGAQSTQGRREREK